MTRTITPDQLDTVAAQGDGSAAAKQQLSAEQACAALEQLFRRGPIERLPKKQTPRRALLAVLCLNLQRRRAYNEAELNLALLELLAALRVQADQATTRRMLIDLGFLKRDRAGLRYFLNWPKVTEVLSAEAIEQLQGYVQL